ncbi:hypothetical protein EVAR_97171_1 [Eumeta japonica]|uniref:Uncharacterized protein n=1 Tax=Eumeta variegata TaxID=151549 RepID=A0A4C1XVF0_EUMVA|nr:hypothetical protein EVAR_97171_1 [Eumeta japonica]
MTVKRERCVTLPRGDLWSLSTSLLRRRPVLYDTVRKIRYGMVRYGKFKAGPDPTMDPESTWTTTPRLETGLTARSTDVNDEKNHSAHTRTKPRA